MCPTIFKFQKPAAGTLWDALSLGEKIGNKWIFLTQPNKCYQTPLVDATNLAKII